MEHNKHSLPSEPFSVLFLGVNVFVEPLIWGLRLWRDVPAGRIKIGVELLGSICHAISVKLKKVVLVSPAAVTPHFKCPSKPWEH